MSRATRIVERQGLKRKYRVIEEAMRLHRPLLEAQALLKRSYEDGFKAGYAACGREMQPLAADTTKLDGDSVAVPAT